MGHIRLLFLLTVAWLSCSEFFYHLLRSLPNLILNSSKKRKENLLTRFKNNTIWTNFGNKKRNNIMPLDLSFLQLSQWFRDTRDELKFAWSNTLHFRVEAQNNTRKLYNSVPHSDLILTALGTLTAAWFLRRSLHRYKNANDLPLSFFEGRKQKKLKGIAVSVNDSDNIRFYHQPHFYSFFRPNLSRQDLKYHTINVRLAGIDAPEVIKSKMPS